MMRKAILEKNRKPGQPIFHITAAEAFPAMEQLVLDARNTLDISLHIFSPRTKTRNKNSHERRLLDWSDLLLDCVKRGIHLRLMVNDFDPIGAPKLHTNAWERISFLEEAFAAQKSLSGSCQVIVGLPGGRSGKLIQMGLWPFIRDEAKAALSDLQTHQRRIPPRIDAILTPDGIVRTWPPAPNYTQAFHQKFLIADNAHAILGGLDIDERRFDDTDHEVPAPETWHDVDVEFTGDAVPALSDHFEASWALADKHGKTILERNSASLIGKEPERSEHMPAYEDDGGSVVTTAGHPVDSYFSFGPVPDVKEIEATVIDLIQNAKHFIYAESQYFRSSIIRDAFIKAAKNNKKLHVILLLPSAPDVVAFDGQESPVHRYAEWLQMRALHYVGKAFGGRFGAFSLTNHLDRDEQVERDALHGKSVVYVHSKIFMRDDEEVLVSSANLNGRSMQWDFEAGYLSKNPDATKLLRKRLWLNHLGAFSENIDPCADPSNTLAAWRSCAADWEKGEPKDKLCGIVPFPIKRTKRFAKRHFFIPENMV